MKKKKEEGKKKRNKKRKKRNTEGETGFFRDFQKINKNRGLCCCRAFTLPVAEKGKG